MMGIATWTLLVLGSAFLGLAALGVVRLPDTYTRMHAATKAPSLGLSLLFLGTAAAHGDATAYGRAAIGIVSLLLTAPLSAHLLSRAAHRAGAEMSDRTVRDDLYWWSPDEEEEESARGS